MRQELHAGEYRDYRWAPPTVLFSWASFVGWSRIHAYKHFVSDVMVGAAVGVLPAESLSYVTCPMISLVRRCEGREFNIMAFGNDQ